MTFARFYRIAALALCALPLLLPSFGCKAEHLESTGEDDSFLRAPGEKPAEVAMADGPLLPTTPGTRWTYATQTEIRSENMQETTPKIGEEQVVAQGPRTVGKSTGTVFKIYQNGKAFREEVFHLDDRGLSLVAAGISSGAAVDTMSITPGIPLVDFPIEEGKVISWEGILRLQKNNIQAPGYAHSRVSGRETLELPLGKSNAKIKVGAYKIETMISTTVEGRPIYLYSGRWFAPGYGIVRQLVVSGRQVITKTLTGFTRAGNSTKLASNR